MPKIEFAKRFLFLYTGTVIVLTLVVNYMVTYTPPTPPIDYKIMEGDTGYIICNGEELLQYINYEDQEKVINIMQ